MKSSKGTIRNWNPRPYGL